jgi:GntR family transcriptional regulator, gluconate operon transcriptional repressor
MTTTLRPLRSPDEPNLGQQAANMLRQAIIAGELTSGLRLVEEDLAARLGVSRGPVRDALRQLAEEGLVELGRRGSCVVRLGPREIRELYSLRAVLEQFALELAVESFTGDDLAAVQTALDAMANAAQAERMAEFVAQDMAFHSAFFERAGHRRLLRVWQTLSRPVEAMLEVTSIANPRTDAILDKHRRILEAVRGRDVAAAHHWLRAHLDEAREVLEETYRH